jgi:methyl-accepting chemotaxis protein
VAELAGQLGILSLNATIEEARRPTARGTRGGATPSRTTGVLIDELRSLAERVSGVSTQITEHAVALRDETRTVATSVGEARASLGTGEAALAEAGDALGAVAAAIASAASGAAPARDAGEPSELDAALARLRAAHAALEARLGA